MRDANRPVRDGSRHDQQWTGRDRKSRFEAEENASTLIMKKKKPGDIRRKGCAECQRCRIHEAVGAVPKERQVDERVWPRSGPEQRRPNQSAIRHLPLRQGFPCPSRASPLSTIARANAPTATISSNRPTTSTRLR
jgi:hypothetical protein